MPNRILRESILTSDCVNQLDAAEEVFYRRLMSVVDDYGLFDARPGIVRAACFPLVLDKIREADCSRWMAACQKAGLIVLYSVDSKPYLKLLRLGEPRAKYSKFPHPPENVAQVVTDAKPARTCAQAHASVPYSPPPPYSSSPTNAPTTHPSLPQCPAFREVLRACGVRSGGWKESDEELRRKGISPFHVLREFERIKVEGGVRKPAAVLLHRIEEGLEGGKIEAKELVGLSKSWPLLAVNGTSAKGVPLKYSTGNTLIVGEERIQLDRVPAGEVVFELGGK